MRDIRDFRDFDILLLPGWRGAGEQHWQTHWQRAFPNMRRVEQADWERPVFAHWARRLSEEVDRCRQPVVLIAHSLGTSLVMRWSHDADVSKVAGAFLVAPTDRDREDLESHGSVVGFGPMLLRPLPFASMVLASENDEHVALDRARLFAQSWGARFINVGALGHIGSVADLGLWPHGLVWLGEFLASLPGRAK